MLISAELSVSSQPENATNSIDHPFNVLVEITKGLMTLTIPNGSDLRNQLYFMAAHVGKQFEDSLLPSIQRSFSVDRDKCMIQMESEGYTLDIKLSPTYPKSIVDLHDYFTHATLIEKIVLSNFKDTEDYQKADASENGKIVVHFKHEGKTLEGNYKFYPNLYHVDFMVENVPNLPNPFLCEAFRLQMKQHLDVILSEHNLDDLRKVKLNKLDKNLKGKVKLTYKKF